MRPSNVPDYAIALPPDEAHNPEYLLRVITSIIDEAAREDSSVLATYNLACADWQIRADRNRAMGLALPSKPSQQPSQQVNTFEDPVTKVVYVWITPGVLMGDPCPDLPPLPPAPVEGTVHIVRRIFGAVFSAGMDDRYPVGGPDVTATADDGTHGTFRRRGSAIGNGYWDLVS